MAEALLNTPAESILPIVIDHTDYGPVNHELQMALLSLGSPTLVEEENNNNNNNIVDFTEAGLKEVLLLLWQMLLPMFGISEVFVWYLIVMWWWYVVEREIK